MNPATFSGHTTKANNSQNLSPTLARLFLNGRRMVEISDDCCLSPTARRNKHDADGAEGDGSQNSVYMGQGDKRSKPRLISNVRPDDGIDTILQARPVRLVTLSDMGRTSSLPAPVVPPRSTVFPRRAPPMTAPRQPRSASSDGRPRPPLPLSPNLARPFDLPLSPEPRRKFLQGQSSLILPDPPVMSPPPIQRQARLPREDSVTSPTYAATTAAGSSVTSGPLPTSLGSSASHTSPTAVVSSCSNSQSVSSSVLDQDEESPLSPKSEKSVSPAKKVTFPQELPASFHSTANSIAPIAQRHLDTIRDEVDALRRELRDARERLIDSQNENVELRQNVWLPTDAPPRVPLSDQSASSPAQSPLSRGGQSSVGSPTPPRLVNGGVVERAPADTVVLRRLPPVDSEKLSPSAAPEDHLHSLRNSLIMAEDEMRARRHEIEALHDQFNSQRAGRTQMPVVRTQSHQPPIAKSSAIRQQSWNSPTPQRISQPHMIMPQQAQQPLPTLPPPQIAYNSQSHRFAQHQPFTGNMTNGQVQQRVSAQQPMQPPQQKSVAQLTSNVSPYDTSGFTHSPKPIQRKHIGTSPQPACPLKDSSAQTVPPVRPYAHKGNNTEGGQLVEREEVEKQQQKLIQRLNTFLGAQTDVLAHIAKLAEKDEGVKIDTPAILNRLAEPTTSTSASLDSRLAGLHEIACTLRKAIEHRQECLGVEKKLPQVPVDCADCKVLKEKLTKLSNDNQKLVESHKTETDTLHRELDLHNSASLQSDLRDLEQELLDVQTSHTDDVRELTAQYEDRLDQMKDQLDEEESRRRRLQEDMKVMKTHGEQSVSRLHDTHVQSMKALKERYGADLRAAIESHKEELNDEKEATRRALDAVQRSHREELAKFEAQLDLMKADEYDEFSDNQEVHDTIERMSQELQDLARAYSDKCVENSQLSDQLADAKRTMTRSKSQDQIVYKPKATAVASATSPPLRQRHVSVSSAKSSDQSSFVKYVSDHSDKAQLSPFIPTCVIKSNSDRKMPGRRNDVRFHSTPASDQIVLAIQQSKTTPPHLAVPVSQRRRFFEQV